MKYFWGKYKYKKGYQLLYKQDGEYYTFAWDCPLTERDIKEYSEIIPAKLITPDGLIYEN